MDGVHADEVPLPLQGVPPPVQGEPGPVLRHDQSALAPRGSCSPRRPVWPSDAALWHLLDTAKTNHFSPPGVVEAIEQGLCVAPKGEVVATVQSTALWMNELGNKMWSLGLDNKSAVLIGAQQQLYTLDGSPRARIGETIADPCPDEFPLQLFKATISTLRTRPLPASLTFSTRTWGQSSATRSPSPGRTAREGPY